MKSSNLVSTAELADHLDDPSWILIDCRFNLNFPEKGENDYQETHIPGALYANLDRDLSAPVGNGQRGRHPLPDPETCVQTFSSFGIEAGKQVVAYDDSGGAISGRLWWMLQWLGHENTALLDGGWQQWIQEKRELLSGKETSLSGEFQADTPKPWILEAEQIRDALKNDEILLLDVRNGSRFRGEKEPIDPVAGHIPGAKNEPFQVNLEENGLWKNTETLRRQYLERFPDLDHKKCVPYCGSGVTACHTFFALRYAGFDHLSIYPGSWSEWISDASRPVAVGEE